MNAFLVFGRKHFSSLFQQKLKFVVQILFLFLTEFWKLFGFYLERIWTYINSWLYMHEIYMMYV